MDKNGDKNAKNISYILQFIDSTRFVSSSYQILSIIFLKEFIELNVNMGMMRKNAKLVELDITIATVTFNIQILKMI